MVRFSLFVAVLSWAAPASAFAPSVSRTSSSTSVRTSATTTTSNTRLFNMVDTSENAQRDYNTFQEWASNYGVAQESGFSIGEQFGEWGGVANEAAAAGSRVLYVPAMLRLTSSNIRQQEFPQLENAVAQYFDATNSLGQINLACQFYLFLKILQEYDQGDQSAYYSWMNALPRKFTTSLNFDPFEIECLPPFVAYLAQQDRHNFDLFTEVLNACDIPSISPNTKQNLEVCKWAFNVVFTRARAAFEEAEIIPMADMLNHAASPNVEVQYDGEGNVHLTLLNNVQAGEPLLKSYGQSTNPSRFLATYGFFDVSSPATYCKLMSGKTLTPELVNLGFVYERMVFYTENGAIADEVWDVMLYTLLEQVDPQGAKIQFYNAHMQGDANAKQQMHAQYRYQTCTGLLDHIDDMLNTLGQCANRMQQGGNQGHTNLPMIQQHNDKVRDTFQMVRNNVEQIQAQSQ